MRKSKTGGEAKSVGLQACLSISDADGRRNRYIYS